MARLSLIWQQGFHMHWHFLIKSSMLKQYWEKPDTEGCLFSALIIPFPLSWTSFTEFILFPDILSSCTAWNLEPRFLEVWGKDVWKASPEPENCKVKISDLLNSIYYFNRYRFNVKCRLKHQICWDWSLANHEKRSHKN
jgi:hypothetical protein